MSIFTRSSFNYGHTITSSNYAINFNEGAGELTASLNIGDFTLEEMAIETARAMTAAGTQTYSCVVDRSTRKLTISATSNFDLLITSGSSVSVGAFSLLGFTGADVTGANSYEGNNASGSQYVPQFYLQSYTGPEDWKEASSASVNESGSGIPQVVSFGTVQFLELNIAWVTDLDQGNNSPIETNLNGISDLRNFLDNITNKTRIEFMPDKDTPSTYHNLIIESTESNKDGVGYKIKRMRDLAKYFQTGIIKFRKVT